MRSSQGFRESVLKKVLTRRVDPLPKLAVKPE